MMVGAKPLSEPMLEYCHLELRNKLQWKLKRNSYTLIQENAFQNVVWKMAAILSRPQCVKGGIFWESRSIPWILKPSQIAMFMGPTCGPSGSCRPQMGPMLAPWTLLSGLVPYAARPSSIIAFTMWYRYVFRFHYEEFQLPVTISVKNEIKCKVIFMFSQKNSTRQGLSYRRRRQIMTLLTADRDGTSDNTHIITHTIALVKFFLHIAPFGNILFVQTLSQTCRRIQSEQTRIRNKNPI